MKTKNNGEKRRNTKTKKQEKPPTTSPSNLPATSYHLPPTTCSNILELAWTVPNNLVCLTLGLEPLRYVFMRRRLFYQQHLLKQNNTFLIQLLLLT